MCQLAASAELMFARCKGDLFSVCAVVHGPVPCDLAAVMLFQKQIEFALTECADWFVCMCALVKARATSCTNIALNERPRGPLNNGLALYAL